MFLSLVRKDNFSVEIVAYLGKTGFLYLCFADMQKQFPIGVFDSGYGGLTILKEFVARMPEYDFIYLGDNARAPYGNRSFETVYEYTLDMLPEIL